MAAGRAPLENGLHLDVAEGAVTLSNQGGVQVVNTGQFAYVPNVATAPVIVPAPQGIQVTMPPSIAKNNARFDEGCSIK